MATYFEGAVKSGSTPSEFANVGYAVFAQSVVVSALAAAGNNNVDVSLTVPRGAQIHSINVDTLTAWDSVTSASLTIGTTAGGAEFYDATDVKTNGRETTTITAADLGLWQDVGATNTLVIRVAQTGTTAAGQARVTVLYSPKS